MYMFTKLQTETLKKKTLFTNNFLQIFQTVSSQICQQQFNCFVNRMKCYICCTNTLEKWSKNVID